MLICPHFPGNATAGVPRLILPVSDVENVSLREQQFRVGVVDWTLLCVQFVTGVTGIVVAFSVGLLRGSLEPLVSISGWASVLLVYQVVLYFVAIVLTGVVSAGVAGRMRSGRDNPEFSASETGAAASFGDRFSTPRVLGAGVGAVLGAALVFGVPEWLSTQLPLVALSVASVAFVTAGDVVSIRGLGATLSAAGGTIFLFVLPAVLFPVVGPDALWIAAGVGVPLLVAVRSWIRVGGRFDRRVAAILVVALALISGGLIAYDLSGPRPATSFDHVSTVDLSAAENRDYAVTDVIRSRPMVRVGTVEVRNDFAFARTADVPSYGACLYTSEGKPYPPRPAATPAVETDTWVRQVTESRLPGHSEREFAVVVLLDQVDGLTRSEIENLGTVPVRRAERCPDTNDGPELVLVPADETDGAAD